MDELLSSISTEASITIFIYCMVRLDIRTHEYDGSNSHHTQAILHIQEDILLDCTD